MRIIKPEGSIIRNNDQDRQEIGLVETSDENGWLRYFCFDKVALLIIGKTIPSTEKSHPYWFLIYGLKNMKLADFSPIPD
jgi:hypothetical protein